MSASIVQLTEPAFHEILNFVAAMSRLSERQSLLDLLRQLGSGALHLDEMVIGRCAGSAGAAHHPHGCSSFNPVVSLTDGQPTFSSSPGASSQGDSHFGIGGGSVPTKHEAEQPVNGRVVVCHRRNIEELSLCIVSSAKEHTREELLMLLRTLLPHMDDAFHRIDPEHGCAQSKGKHKRPGMGVSLTSREREVLHWTAQGKGCWEIGLIVGISERTVKFHLQNIYRKLNVVNRAQAVAKAAQTKLLPIAI